MKFQISNLKSEIRNPSGQAIVMVLLALTLAVLLVAGLLYYASTSQRATQAAGEQTVQRYSMDAGVEYGLWLLQNTNLTQTLQSSPYCATTSISINGQTAVITITRVLTP
jgi:type II secretory pathway component PulK